MNKGEMKVKIEQQQGKIAGLQAENERLRTALLERIDQLEAELEKHRWIPVSERPPEKSGQVWICYEITGYTYQAYYDVEYKKWGIFDPCGGFSDIDFGSPPTHWKLIILPEQALKGDPK